MTTQVEWFVLLSDKCLTFENSRMSGILNEISKVSSPFEVTSFLAMPILEFRKLFRKRSVPVTLFLLGFISDEIALSCSVCILFSPHSM